MRRSGAGRAGFGLLASGVLVGLVRPRSLPRLDLLDPADRSARITEFGLHALATLLALYLVLVFLGLLLSALRMLPASARSVVARWTSRGLAGGLRRLVGISALAIGVLPIQPLAAHGAESAPTLAPADAPAPAPPATSAPRLEPAPPLGPVEPVETPPPRAPANATDSPRAVPHPAATVTVGPGDSFWSIAERMTVSRLGRAVGDDEVIEPWLALIAANRDRLAIPDDPDLLFPGQVLRLPD